jgi:hypothetical protein
MLLDLGRAVSFIGGIVMLYWVMLSAFFAPGMRWQEQLTECALRVALAACVCFASGLLFAWRPSTRQAVPSPLSTLPMRLFFWGLGAMAGFLALSWYIEEYYLPLARKG